MAVFVPLKGPGAEKPKAPSPLGWTGEHYRGVARDYGGWVGLRTDNLVVIDCDSEAAMTRWKEHVDSLTGWVVPYTMKTPRGYHFYYEAVPGGPEGPTVDIWGDNSGIDCRAGRTSQVVVPPTPGYAVLWDEDVPPYEPAWWVPENRPSLRDVEGDEGWYIVPDGKRNDTLARIGGTMRSTGAAVPTIQRFLLALNRTFCDPPMHEEEVVAIARSLGRYSADPVIEIED